MTTTNDSDSVTYAIGAFPTFVYILASFVANAGVSITGFGMALIFVFVVTIVDVATNFSEQSPDSCNPAAICDTKHTVFLQSLSLVGSIPFLMAKANIRVHANKRLLSTLVPVTLISTPAGQYLQSKVSSAWICIVLGVVISFVVGWKLLDHCLRRPTVEHSRQPLTKKERNISERTSLLVVARVPTDDTEVEDHGGADNQEPTNGSSSLPAGVSSRSIVVWGILLGCASGFLGGLIGMRGPPLMVFFLVFPFPKTETRAVGAIMLCLNMVLRIAYYWWDDAHRTNNNNSDLPWFLAWSTAWPLYVGVVVAGILGVPIGDWIHHRIDQTKFKLALGVLLSASGIVNIAKGWALLKQNSPY